MSNNADPRTPNSPRNESTSSGTKFLLTGELRDSDGKEVSDADDSIDTRHYSEIIDSMKTHLKKHLLNCLEVSYGGDHGTGEASIEFEHIPPMKFTLKSRRTPSKSRLRNLFTRRKMRHYTMKFHGSLV